jgi:hypothetical protein
MRKGFLRVGSSIDVRSMFRSALGQFLCALSVALLLAGCGGGSAAPPPPPPISVSVAPRNPPVQVSQPQLFTATVSNSSNTSVTWALTQNAAACSPGCGTLSSTTANPVTYTAPAIVPTPATVTITATSVADNTKNGATTITVTQPSSGIAVSVSPKRAAVTTSQTQQFSATVTGNNNHGVTWFVDNIMNGNAATGQIDANGVYAPGTQAGRHNVTAQSVVDGTSSAASFVAVTDLAGVFSWRGTEGDTTRQGVNPKEYALETTTVKNNFGKLFSCHVDGYMYAQPLYVANLTMGDGKKHNVVFVATEQDNVYAFDADASPCVQFWHQSMLGNGENFLDQNDVSGCSDLVPNVGITGTPVIDPVAQTLYVSAESKDSATSTQFFHRLHALNLVDGSDRVTPSVIQASINTTVNGTVSFDTTTGYLYNQRPGLLLLNGVVYIAWGSHCDLGAYHGWLMGYNAGDLTQAAVFNVTPNGSEGAVWMTGGAPSADSSGNVYVVTGNGTFDANSAVAPKNDYGDSFLKLNAAGGLSVADYFTPFNQDVLNAQDLDLGDGTMVLLPDQSGSSPTHLGYGAGKEGKLYLVDRDFFGNFTPGGPDAVQQSFSISTHGFWSTPAFWNNTLYAGPTSNPLMAFSFDTATKQFSTTASSSTAAAFGYPGLNPAVSSQGANANGIVWAIDANGFGTPKAAVLHAFDATNLASELYSSGTKVGDAAGNAVKFTVPVIANGKVYIGTQSELDVYGLLPN